jgi:toxin ParE1/3/4
MRLVWNTFARADRRAIYDYIEPEDPRAAIRIDERLEEAVERLVDFPNSGRPGRIDGTRELVVSGTPYIIPYRVLTDRILLLRVLHGAQQWPKGSSKNKRIW